MEIVVVIALVLGAWAALAMLLRAARRKRLMEKYGDTVLVDKLMRRMFWTGQTQEQLIDSLGRPAEIDQKVMKTRVREIWKYNRRTRTRFGLRITLDNGLVAGWDQQD